MAALVTTAAVAATAATAAYLEAKYAIRKDIREFRKARQVGKAYVQAIQTKRLSLYYLFEESVKRRGEDDCIWSRTGCYSWNETYDRVNQYAQWFLSQGVKPRDYVSFYLTNSPDFIFAWLGLWAIGAAPAMTNFNLTGKALLNCLRSTGSKLLLVDSDVELRARIEELRAEIEGGENGIRIKIMDDIALAEISASKAERPSDVFREVVKPDWPMAMFFTSGTTGLPKGVPFNLDRGFMTALSRAGDAIQTNDNDRWYDCMPLYHGTGGVTAMTTMMSGITLCIGKKFSTSRFWGEVHDSRATYITYVGETARYLLAAPPSPLDKDHNVRCMYGNGLRTDVWVKFRERFNVPEVAEFFASSEGVLAILNHCRGDYLVGAVGFHGAIARYLTRNLMVPVRIDQDTGAIARHPKTGFAYREPYEKGGEIIIQVSSKGAFAGYHNNPEETAKKFETDVFKKGDLWYRSGDALLRDTQGRWYFKDRLGDTFRWKGENVSTAEVSEVLGKYPGVVEANVYGVLLPSHDGRAGCAAIYIDPSVQNSFDYRGLLEHARNHLPKYAVPIFLRIVKAMTPIHNNKQNKVPLRAEGVDPQKVHADDRIMIIDGRGKGETYVDFESGHWDQLERGILRL